MQIVEMHTFQYIDISQISFSHNPELDFEIKFKIVAEKNQENNKILKLSCFSLVLLLSLTVKKIKFSLAMQCRKYEKKNYLVFFYARFFLVNCCLPNVILLISFHRECCCVSVCGIKTCKKYFFHSSKVVNFERTLFSD